MTNNIGKSKDFSFFGIQKIVKISLLSAIAVVLMFLEFPLPIFPGFLKVDLSDLPAVIGGFALGPVAGIAIEFLKNILHFFIKNDGTGGIGNLANFIVGIGFVVPASIIYLRNKTKKIAIAGMIVGMISMVILSSIVNYFVLIPLYQKIMPLDQIITYAAKANPGIVDVKTYILYAVIPFNILKSVLVSIVTLFIYKKLSPILHS